MFYKNKRFFGNGKNEFRVDARCWNGSDCMVATPEITLRINGCHCDALALLSRALMEFEEKHPELFEEAVTKEYTDSFSKEFWEVL